MTGASKFDNNAWRTVNTSAPDAPVVEHASDDAAYEWIWRQPGGVFFDVHTKAPGDTEWTIWDQMIDPADGAA